MTKNENLTALIDKAIAGHRDSLETVILSVRDLIFNLSLRMLGTFHDAEKSILAEELKLSCTNVMLQCLDTDDRLVFVLGTMRFKATG